MCLNEGIIYVNKKSDTLVVGSVCSRRSGGCVRLGVEYTSVESHDALVVGSSVRGQ